MFINVLNMRAGMKPPVPMATIKVGIETGFLHLL